MADDTGPATAGSTGTETPTQRQARLRREKRQKKMADEGEDRLNRIKALNGGVAPPAEILGGEQKPLAPTVHDDPEEVDISRFANVSNIRSQQSPPNDPFAAAMSQLQSQHVQGQGHGGPGDDPMMRLMQQMMGSMGAAQDPNNPNADGQLPQMLQSLMNNANQQQAQQEAAPAQPDYLWKIVHAIFAITLATYVAFTSPFIGTELARSESIYTESTGNPFGPRLFVIFTTIELVLQSMRYFVEGGQLRGTGMLATVANSGFIPPPYSNWIRIAGRYITIIQAIFSDLMIIVFVLGALAWWRGLDNPAA